MLAFIDYEDEDDHIYIIPIEEDGQVAGDMITIDAPEKTGGIRLLAGWTPDDKIGVIIRSLTEFGLYTLPAKGGKAGLVVHGGHGGYLAQPRWSPDGKIIFHTDNKNKSRDWQELAMAVVSAEGGEVTTVPIQSDEKILLPSWGGGTRISADGKIIVFTAQTEKDTSWHWQIWTLPVAGGKPKQLTKTPAWVVNGFSCWSPDGKAIAYVRTKEDKNYTKGNSETNIYIIPVDGGDPKPLTLESDSVAFSPIAWSPDGKQIAFSSNKKLKIISLNDGDSRVVAKIKVGELAWSPDSKRIAFNGPDGKVIKIVSIKDGSIEDIETDLVDVNIYHFDWSPDGDKFVFAGYRGDSGGDSPEFWVMEDFMHLVKAKR